MPRPVLVKAAEEPDVDALPVAMYTLVRLLKAYLAKSLSPLKLVLTLLALVKSAVEWPKPKVTEPTGTCIPYVVLLSAASPSSFIDICEEPKNSFATPKS